MDLSILKFVINLKENFFLLVSIIKDLSLNYTVKYTWSGIHENNLF